MNGPALRVLHHLGNVGMTGVETFLLMLVAAQRRAGLVPSIACAPDGREELLRSAAAIGVPVFPLESRLREGRGGLWRKLSTLGARGKQYRQLVDLLRHADVLHAHAVGIGGLEALLAARRTGARAIVTHHATLTFFAPFRSRMSDLTFALEKRVAHRVVLPYAEAAREMVAAGVPSARVMTIPFCVELRKFEDRPSAPAPLPGELRLLVSARLVEGKGHRELLEAVARLRPRFPGLRLMIAGAGPLEPALRTQVQALELQDAVAFTGHLPTERMPALMQEADAIVLPSYMEGETFPISLLEGMAAGLPTVGTRWFGIPDIIQDGETGYLVPPRDVPALADALERLVSDPARMRAMGAAARTRARERYSADVVAAQYTALYSAAGS